MAVNWEGIAEFLGYRRDQIDLVKELVLPPYGSTSSNHYPTGNPKVEYVAQPNNYGCAIACLAMVLGYSYKEMEAWLEKEGLTAERRAQGISDFVYRDVIYRHGLGTVHFYRYDLLLQKDREPWPPIPFAPVHICCVEVEGGFHHAVVMLQDGTILDPYKMQRRTLTHPDYKGVAHVTGIYSIYK